MKFLVRFVAVLAVLAVTGAVGQALAFDRIIVSPDAHPAVRAAAALIAEALSLPAGAVQASA